MGTAGEGQRGGTPRNARTDHDDTHQYSMPQAKGRSYRPDPNGSPAVLYVSAVGQMGMVVIPTITLGDRYANQLALFDR